MKKQTDKPTFLPLLITGIAVILFSTAGVARMMGWGLDSPGAPGGILALGHFPEASAQTVAVAAQAVPKQAEGAARARRRCEECGMIVSTREIDARDEGAGLDTTGGLEKSGLEKSGATLARYEDVLLVESARRYEMTIRLADGASRVINHAGPARWRPGERVIVIDGANPSPQ